MKIKITTDSSCDYPVDELKKLGIPYIPIIVVLKEEEFLDTINITPKDIFTFVKNTNKLPKTAAPSVESIKSFFEKELEGGYTIIHIGLGKKLSATTVNAESAAKEIGGDRIYVVDTQSLSTGISLLVFYALDLLKQNKYSAKEITDKVQNRIKSVQASFVVDTLDYLHKGGRCSAMAAFGANLLKLKPRLQLEEGEIVSDGKYRGKINMVYLKYIDDTLSKFNNPDTTRCFVTHSYAEQDTVDKVVEYVKSKKIFKEVIETKAGSTITSHCGKGTLGILYINDGGKV